MKIIWSQVTSLSQIVAIVLFVAVFGVGFWVGQKFESSNILGKAIASADFICPDKHVVHADFYDRLAAVKLPRDETLYLPQTMSASGVRFANKDESIVFWNKGDMIFIEQNGTTTYNNCIAKGAQK